MRNLVIIFFIGLFVIGGVLLFQGKNSSSDSVTPHNSKTASSISSSNTVSSRANSQNKKSIQGKWLLSDVSIEMKRDEEAPLTVENFLWRDVYKNNTPVNFKGNSLTFIKDEEDITATFKMEGNDIILSFTSKDGRISSTIYNIRFEGNDFSIWREDPLVKEEYTFTKV